MGPATSILLILDLWEANIRITAAMRKAFLDADAAGRDITAEELLAAADKTDRAVIRARLALGG